MVEKKEFGLVLRITKKQLIVSGDEMTIPRFYGVAWVDSLTCELVFMPIPLNWIVGSMRNLYFRMKLGPRTQYCLCSHLTAAQREFVVSTIKLGTPPANIERFCTCVEGAQKLENQLRDVLTSNQ